MDEARNVRDYWFGTAPLTADELPERMRFWFGPVSREEQRDQDEEIRQRFGVLMERAASGELDSWTGSPRRLLSLILLLDQFPRNVFRGTSRAFTRDEKALSLLLSGMQSGADAALDPVERVFFYMPLQHSELTSVQEESITAFQRLREEAPADMRDTFTGILQYAELHRDLIERFGRFPHRNRVLGRISTPEEEEYLRKGATFGQ